MTQMKINIPEQIKTAIAHNRAVVTLESTVIAHGLPQPLNLETAKACEQAIGEAGALAATIGIVEGIPTVGLNEAELRCFAEGRAPDGRPIEKVSLSNLAAVISTRRWGATTVSASMKLAHLAGLKVFSTGGIGGVHRGASETFDISADLTALAQIPVICVSAGAKAILDLPKTVEHLETLGVPVVGFHTAEFPAFYSRTSGLPVDATVENADEVAAIALQHWRLGSMSAVLVGVPVPETAEIPASKIARATDAALKLAETNGIRGKAVTPFLLAQMKEMTAGETLAANQALLINNARVAAQIAVSLVKAN
jgi:pseudouridine-5'-phosphate glycosidase